MPLANRLRMTAGRTSWPPCSTRAATRAIASSGARSDRNMSFTVKPAARQSAIRRRYECPASVVSNAKLWPSSAWRSISSSISRPARNAAASGLNGDRPAAIKSALMKTGQPASEGRSRHGSTTRLCRRRWSRTPWSSVRSEECRSETDSACLPGPSTPAVGTVFALGAAWARNAQRSDDGDLSPRPLIGATQRRSRSISITCAPGEPMCRFRPKVIGGVNSVANW